MVAVLFGFFFMHLWMVTLRAAVTVVGPGGKVRALRAVREALPFPGLSPDLAARGSGIVGGVASFLWGFVLPFMWIALGVVGYLLPGMLLDAVGVSNPLVKSPGS